MVKMVSGRSGEGKNASVDVDVVVAGSKLIIVFVARLKIGSCCFCCYFCCKKNCCYRLLLFVVVVELNDVFVY